MTVAPDGVITTLGIFQGAVAFDPAEPERLYPCENGCGFLLRLAPDGSFLSVSIPDSGGPWGMMASDEFGNVISGYNALSGDDLNPTCEQDIRTAPWPGAVTGIIKLNCEPRRGDFDGDGRVDLRDLAAFQNCFEGEGATACNPGCDEFDLTPDNAIDLSDLERLLDLRGGP